VPPAKTDLAHDAAVPGLITTRCDDRWMATASACNGARLAFQSADEPSADSGRVAGAPTGADGRIQIIRLGVF
jgi:hypothetical protein